MTFAVLRALHTIIGDALNEIEGVYLAHGQSLEVIPAEEIAESRHKPALSNEPSYAYVSPPPSPCISSPPERIPPPLDHQSGSRTPALDFPSLDAPCDPNSLSEALTAHPTAINRGRRRRSDKCDRPDSVFESL
ncbi:hypothetical protein K443DRAFT_13508 [Laccaria amethystina LaAM-08-1]|uniref:Uncharacterized protein n=1 Tax=Laccaria amethystina LaAM-08-1 TaxID=1095629 RepID=A0A0C9WV99_9AGAR|nr:hypothetical protein K443DRAFT_13508 [Laccaria amethystina LaAM-08-1]